MVSCADSERTVVKRRFSLRPLFWVTLALFAVVYFLALALRSTLETFATPQSGDQALPMQLLESEDLRAVIGYADSYCG